MSNMPTQNFSTIKVNFHAFSRRPSQASAWQTDPKEVAIRRDARAQSAAVRLAVPKILTHARHGAMHLRNGREWAHDLKRFETLSMEQAKVLSDFPIAADNPEFGALVQRARSAFVAFREMVRRELIGKADAASDPAALDMMLDHITNRAALAVRSLYSLESALAE